METTDRTLLERFIALRDEVAFRMLVGRHLDLVHAVAKRVTASEDLARDVAQATFVRLAQRAALIPPDVSLTAWLHRTCRSLAIDLVRSEVRRKQRESTAISHGAMNASSDIDWARLAPVIDELVDSLSAADRELVLAKYYRNESHASIAARLGLTETNTRQRASRALEKLRLLLSRRGIATSVAALATVLPSHAIAPAPASLVLAVSSAASGVVPLAPQALTIHLAMTASQKSAVVAASVVFLASLGYAFRPMDGVAAAVPRSGTVATPPATDASLRGRVIRPLPASTGERLERLREILSLTTSARRTRELLDFTDQLPAPAFTEMADFLDSWKGRSILKEYELVMAAWAKVDPEKAAGWANADPVRRFLYTVLSCWGESDPGRALDWVKRHSPTAATGHQSMSDSTVAVALGIAARDIGAAVEALDAIPDEKNRANAVYWLGTRLMSTRPGGLDALLEKVKPGPGRTRLVEMRFQRLLNTDPQRAWESLKGDEDAFKESGGKNLFTMWRSDNVATAEAMIKWAPEGELRDAGVRRVCLECANKDPKGAFELLWRNPGAADDMTIAKMVQDSDIHWLDQAFKIEDETLRDEILAGCLTRWASHDKNAAHRWMDARKIPAALREKVELGTYNPRR